MTLRERMEAEAKFLDSEGIRRSFLASQLIGTPDYEKTRDVGRVYRFIADRIREAINMHDIEMKEGSLMERQAEYGERRVICPLYKAAAIQGYMGKGKGIPYVGPFDEIACNGDRCGMYNLCQAKRGRGIDVLIKPPAVPGL